MEKVGQSDHRSVAIVLIKNSNLRGGFGTGFFISENQILTCYHCVKTLNCEVEFEYGNCSELGKILYKDEEKDLAILETEKRFEVISPFFSEDISLEEDVFALGYNHSLGEIDGCLGVPLKERGIIYDIKPERVVICNTEISDGYSGCPLLKGNDVIIGIVRLADKTRKIGVAISVKRINNLCEVKGIKINIQKGILETYNDNLRASLESKIYQYNYFERLIKKSDGEIFSSLDDFVNEIKKKRFNIILGVGGAGKSFLLYSISLNIINKNIADSFTLYSICRNWDKDTIIDNKIDIESRIRSFVVGSKFNEDIVCIIKNDKISKYIFVDGLNEIAEEETRNEIINLLREIATNYKNVVVCITTRNIAFERTTVWNLYQTDGIKPDELSKILMRNFKKGEGDYDERNFEFLKLPFFLNLAIKNHDDTINSYSEYIRKHIFKGFDNCISEIQSFLSEEAYNAYVQTSTSHNKFLIPSSIDNENTISRLKLDNRIVFKKSNGYALGHQLINEYFVAQHISKNSDLWNKDVFHSITFENRVSFQVMQMILEQIKETRDGDKFLIKLYDWNFYAVLHCIRYVKGKYSEQLARIIILIIAEKLFEDFQHSKEKVIKYLSPPDSSISLFELFGVKCLDKEKLSNLLNNNYTEETKKELLYDVINENIKEKSNEELRKYYDLFGFTDENLNEDLINRILDNNPLTGWCCANVIRRANYSSANELQLRTLYKGSKDDIVHWRIAHALGKAKTYESIELLLRIVETDTYSWAIYGAARSLMEIAFFGESDSYAESIFNKLIELFDKKTYESYIVNEFLSCLQNKILSSRHKMVVDLFNKILESDNFVDFKDQVEKQYNKFKINNGI